MKQEKKERVIPKMSGSASRSLKTLYASCSKSVRRMMQEAEHYAKHTEYAIMGYDVPVQKQSQPSRK